MRNLEIAVRVAVFGFHLDVSVTPFVWSFRRSRMINSRYIEGYIAVGPISVDWSRKSH